MRIRKHETRARVALGSAATLCLAAASIGAAQAADQPASQGGLEEITVTARKVEESLQTVPISVNAFTADALARAGLATVADVGDFAPNVALDFTSNLSGSSNSLTAYIRGLGQPDFALNFEPGVALYVDGVYYARTIGSVVDLLDVERVEVLKGPQGTLFGRNTIGGAISVVTRRPSNDFDFDAIVTGGSRNRLDLSGTVDLPIVQDKLLATVSVASRNQDGYQERIPFDGNTVDNTNLAGNPYLNDILTGVNAPAHHEALGNSNTDTGRVKLLWIASDDVEVTLSADVVRTRETSSPTTLLRTMETRPGALAGLYAACLQGAPGLGSVCGGIYGVNVDALPNNDRLVYDSRFITNDIDKTYGFQFGYSNIDASGGSATVDWDLSDSIHLKSITAYRTLDARFARDPDGSPITLDGPNFRMLEDQYSQEFQLTGLSFDEKLKWLVGAYYFHEEGDMLDMVPLGEGLLQIWGPSSINTDAWAAFADVTYKVTDRFGVSLGARYTQEDKWLEGSQRDLNALPFKMGLPPEAHPVPSDPQLFFPPGRLSDTFTNTSPRINFEYEFSDDVFSYVSASKGYKSGGWPTRLTDPALSVPGFGPEEATAYELGVKTEWLDRTVRVNAAAFFTEYEQLQLTVLRGIAPFTQNGGDAEVKGVEVDFQAQLTDSLYLSGGLGYMDAGYTELNPESVVDDNGPDPMLMNTPEWSTNLGLNYEWALGNGAEGRFHIDHVYRSEVANDPQNTPLLIEGSINLVNASITYVAGSGSWETTFGVKNVTDERYLVAGFDQPAVGYTEGTYSRPREWYVSIRLRH